MANNGPICQALYEPLNASQIKTNARGVYVAQPSPGFEKTGLSIFAPVSFFWFVFFV